MGLLFRKMEAKILKVFIASDHAGFELKEILKAYMIEKKYDVEDLGPSEGKTPVDYPDYAKALGMKVVSTEGSKGVAVCGSGLGISIACNKVKGVRCALCHDHYTAMMSREHNDANILAMGARVIGVEIAKEMIDTFMHTKFMSEHPNHPRRVKKIGEMEI
eukprot:TRINITY_DN1292_c0_g1_i3.p2 TRINITY_DN1292_c0_g1~~TRINITY_DN1292_c0_g1_i3.p2  ORF type:complete len:161 (-),score=24.84 TRINITY_DN1292_c0_g1_i3:168-650(-)